MPPSACVLCCRLASDGTVHQVLYNEYATGIGQCSTKEDQLQGQIATSAFAWRPTGVGRACMIDDDDVQRV